MYVLSPRYFIRLVSLSVQYAVCHYEITDKRIAVTGYFGQPAYVTSRIHTNTQGG